jgi:hypothetical protein
MPALQHPQRKRPRQYPFRPLSITAMRSSALGPHPLRSLERGVVDDPQMLRLATLPLVLWLVAPYALSGVGIKHAIRPIPDQPAAIELAL